MFFACDRISAMGVPAASMDLLHEAREKASDAHTMASRIWSIFRLPLAKIPGRTHIELLMVFC
jgi:hypothetical protein